MMSHKGYADYDLRSINVEERPPIRRCMKNAQNFDPLFRGPVKYKMGRKTGDAPFPRSGKFGAGRRYRRSQAGRIGKLAECSNRGFGETSGNF